MTDTYFDSSLASIQPYTGTADTSGFGGAGPVIDTTAPVDISGSSLGAPADSAVSIAGAATYHDVNLGALPSNYSAVNAPAVGDGTPYVDSSLASIRGGTAGGTPSASAQSTATFGSVGSSVLQWLKSGFSGVDNRGGTGSVRQPGGQSWYQSALGSLFGTGSPAARAPAAGGGGLFGGGAGGVSPVLLIGGALVAFALLRRA